MYDLIIIGGGPAGLSAGLYAARGGLKTLIAEGIGTGGQMNYTYEVANYPAAFDSPSGEELAKRMRMQAEACGVSIGNERVKKIENIADETKTIVTRKNRYETKAIILAVGASPKKLGVPGEDKFSGAGVSYCATCDGAFFKNRITAVIGGGNTAFEDALYLTKFCKKVYLINRSERFRASKILVETAEKSNIEILKNAVVKEIFGSNSVEGIKIAFSDGNETDISCSGVFVAIGRSPNLSAVPEEIQKNSDGFILTDRSMRTNIRGVFAAGDVRDTPLRQIITAAADGAIAAQSAIDLNLKGLNQSADVPPPVSNEIIHVN